MIQKAFGDNAMNAAQMTVWHKLFKDGQESVENDPRSGRPAMSRAPEKLNVYGLQSAKIMTDSVRTSS